MTDTALTIIEEKNVAQYFVLQGLDPIITAIRKEVTGIFSDISTPKGRDEIRSRAAKLASTKTALDAMGKKLTEDQRKQIDAVNAERKRAWDALEALQKEVRAPLTEWENKDKARIALHEAALTELDALAANLDNLTSGELDKRLAEAAVMIDSRAWEEFSNRATLAVESVQEKLTKKQEARRQYEADQAELERHRQERVAREQKERDDRIAAEAAENARKETELKARAAVDKVEQERLEAVRKAKEAADALAAQVKADAEAAAAREEAAKREAAEADARAKKAEEARIDAEEKARADLKAAEEKASADARAAAEKAQRDADEAAKRERDKIEAEKKAEADATAQREADKAHRGKINREALAALVTAGLTLEIGKLAIEAIAKGLIPHVKINY